MPFYKGKPKTGGRKIGTPNTVGKELRERVKELVESHFDDLAASIYELAPKERIVVLLKLMEFVLPKAHSSQVEEVEEKSVYDFSRLPLEKMLLLHSLLEEAEQTEQVETMELTPFEKSKKLDG